MSILLFLLGYLVMGLLVIYGGVLIHLIKAEKKGYRAIDWWADYGDHSNVFGGESFEAKFIYGLFIWPARFGHFLAQIPDLYEAYEYDPEYKSELF